MLQPSACTTATRTASTGTILTQIICPFADAFAVEQRQTQRRQITLGVIAIGYLPENPS